MYALALHAARVALVGQRGGGYLDGVVGVGPVLTPSSLSVQVALGVVKVFLPLYLRQSRLRHEERSTEQENHTTECVASFSHKIKILSDVSLQLFEYGLQI